ncbi:hypothetical protein HPB52_021274 [Rhipicephalus sanguineus]|uniref:Uncharacterized protein n=1 Tax=Rhipicephalus sanguineus TaxID=34632 RepID=A0A9D4T235_RHISA|nr:hypothetical protein HPB52_021274 [Rhipicephalus sanguineus]
MYARRTTFQIVMLAHPPTSRLLTVGLFRVHVHCAERSLLALLFPVLNTRLLPLEQEVYWVQHTLMLAVALLPDAAGWCIQHRAPGRPQLGVAQLGTAVLYHFLILQALALIPSLALIIGSGHWPHQFLLVLVAGKLYTAVAAWIAARHRLRICCSPDPQALLFEVPF